MNINVTGPPKVGKTFFSKQSEIITIDEAQIRKYYELSEFMDLEDDIIFISQHPLPLLNFDLRIHYESFGHGVVSGCYNFRF
ncbi:MAG: hypothetical protein GY795_44760 [Desulfobacterales bacterium]|nr:hypothetical protein [Desulfobacterales bacterium]